ncbi:MAG: c-type cytochrome [Acidobacteriota bacterium]
MLAVLLVALAWPAPVRSQAPPPQFENLQVLPKNIEKKQLVQTMRGFAMSLGVRCWFCHVGKEGEDLSTYDFASDDKPTKRTARIMLRMTREINNTFLMEAGPLLGEIDADAGSDPPRATCATCHRGKEHPVNTPPAPKE